ncbi:hypothetical protein TRVL_04921 [Trypanosoma vivax]|nr:hypothetical protein TRVL_04921 [Trypanosoma vivax]
MPAGSLTWRGVSCSVFTVAISSGLRGIATVGKTSDQSERISSCVDDFVHTELADELEAVPALGVTRELAIPEGQALSRLNIPLKEPSTVTSNVRSNSRSVAAHANATDLQSFVTETADKVDASPLPYDDERFAEMLLEMEVEGSIDEAWQDGPRAHMEDVVELVEVLRSLKVRDICAINVSEKTSSFDFMIFGTCEGPRHIHLAAWAVQEADSLKRVSKIRRKQVDHTWEVVPVGRTVVNLMQEALREELSLERKWAVTRSMDPLAAANAPVSEGRSVRAHGLWTLTLNLQDLEDFEVDYCKDVLIEQL